MANDLPSDFDLILIGTGMVESIVSAAASRIGKRVLHLDSANYYGGLWASFNLDALSSLGNTENHAPDIEKCPIILDVNERLLTLQNNCLGIKDVIQTWYVPEAASNVKSETDNNDTHENGTKNMSEDETKKDVSWTKQTLNEESRKFNIDLAPKLQFARGDLVELLISSNIARYSEFCSIGRVLTWIDDHLEVVPCSRSDVFSNSKVTVIEKRMLMKLLTDCLDRSDQEIAENENKTFLMYLKDRKLTPNLIHYVLYTIAMGTDEILLREGVQNTKRFLNSLGRFGNTPFLYSLYGSGDIMQAFCRLSAVFGAIYALGQRLDGIIFEKDRFKSIICNSQKITAAHLVCSAEKAPEQIISDVKCNKYISRCIFITDRSILASDKESPTLLLFPPGNGKSPCVVIEVGYTTRTSPKGLFLVHIFTEQKVNPKEDVLHCAESLFNYPSNTQTENRETHKPNVLYSFYCSVPHLGDADLKTGVPENVFICPGPDLDLDYDSTIKKAKEIFSTMYPDSEFLPRAPDPEEIIIGGEDDDEKESDSQNVIERDVTEEPERENENSDAGTVKT